MIQIFTTVKVQIFKHVYSTEKIHFLKRNQQKYLSCVDIISKYYKNYLFIWLIFLVNLRDIIWGDFRRSSKTPNPSLLWIIHL